MTGLNIKIRSMGYRFAYTASSNIYHVIPKERMTLSYLVRRVGNQGYCDSYTEYRSHRDRRLILSKGATRCARVVRIRASSSFSESWETSLPIISWNGTSE